MSAPWVVEEGDNAVATYRLQGWSSFYALSEEFAAEGGGARRREFVWRGQRSPSWMLSPSLDRVLARLSDQDNDDALDGGVEGLVQRHLDRFKFAVRGRRGLHPPELRLENEWWALGQHYGLATPLLDWSKSPFAAAYFAFEEDSAEPTDYRAVWGLDRRAVELRNHDLANGESLESGRPPLLEFYEPLSDENPRLVAQGGLFTRTPLRIPVEDWVSFNFAESTAPILIKLLIPCSDRGSCLRALNRMNINHLSLFPDLNGASRYVNLALEVPNL
jgi:hypothetical protein